MLELLGAMQVTSLLDPVAIRSGIRSLHECIVSSGSNIGPSLNVQHHFAPGQYVRELSMPAGSVVIGRTHKQSHLNMLLKGSLFLLTTTGTFTYLEAPAILNSEEGEQKVVLVLRDAVWVTVHNTDHTDLSTIVGALTEEVDDYEHVV